MSGVKNQHYVPRFYLKSFTDGTGFLSVVRRDTGGLNPSFERSPKTFVRKTTSMRLGDARHRVKMVSLKRA